MKNIIRIISLILLFSIKLTAQFQYETSNFPNILYSVTDINFINPNTGYVIGYTDQQSPKLFKTTDKGATWILRRDFGNIQDISSQAAPTISFINANIGWAVIGYFLPSDTYTDYYEVQKTTDGGVTWQVVHQRTFTGTEERINGTIKFINESTGYMINSWTGDFLKSTNGGSNWTIIKNDLGADYDFNTFAISPTNSSKIYLVGVKYNNGNNFPLFYVSTDAGANFQSVYDGTQQNGMKGINNLTIVNNNNTDLVRLASNSKLFEYNNNPQNPFTQISTLPADFFNLSFSDIDKGFATPSNGPNVVYRTENHGLNWIAENLPVYTNYYAGNPLVQFGNILYFNRIPNVTRTLGMNLSVLYDNVNTNGSFSFDGANKDIPSSPTMYYLRGGNSVLNATPVFNSNQDNEIKFYNWNDGSMNYSNNSFYFDNNGDIKASYKTKQKADNAWAINNANQTKAIRDTNTVSSGMIHQVYESIGGIFYSRSTNGGSNYSSEEIVNYDPYAKVAFGNRNPSLTVKRRDRHSLTSDDPDRNVAVVWERYNQSNGKTEILVADRVLNIPQNGYEWSRYEDGNGNNVFTSFNSSADFQSTPKIFISSPLSSLYSSIIVVPHLEKDINTNKTKVVITIRKLNLRYDYIVDDGANGTISNLAVSSPYNDNGVFGLHIVYQKDNSINNIVYKKIFAGWDYSASDFRHDCVETIDNLGIGDGMRARFSPDISVQNGLPVVTYCGNYYDNRIIQYEDETVGDNMISLMKHSTITRFKTTNNGDWSEYERFTGLNPQENPNVEGSKNAMAYLLSFRKNGSYFQYVKINGLQQPYYCNPGSYSETDAKFIRGSYIGQFGTFYNPMLLTLSNLSESRYTVSNQPFSLTTASNVINGYNNLDGIINKNNTQYSLTLGPIIVSNTTSNNSADVGFEDATPPQTVQNPVEFNETMVSAVFTLSNNDTLMLGANGKYATSFGQAMQPLKYHVNLVNASSGQIQKELFRDTIKTEDSVGIEFLRGYVIDRIDKGTDQFYIQMIVDTVDAGDGDYNMSGVYADDTPPQGDAPINYKTKVFFENSSNSLSSGNQIPKEYSLSQNYPNPFNPSTTIKYSLPKDGFVSLKIYDITGREVKTLAGEVKKAGYYSVTFNASSLASGVYFYRIQSNDFVMTKRMVLIK